MSKSPRTMRERAREQSIPKKNTATFYKVYQSFLKVQHARGNSAVTLKHYETSIRKIKRFMVWQSDREKFPQMSDREIQEKGDNFSIDLFEFSTTETEFRNFLLDIEEVSEVTVSTYFRDYRAIAYWMMDEGLIRSRQISFKNAEGNIKNCYTENELSKLLRHPPENGNFTEYRSWVAIHWMLATGNRISTMCNIQIDDIDFEENMININVQKNKKKSRIPLESRLRKVLLEYIDAWLIYDDDNYVSPYLFPSSYTQSSSRPISRYALSQAIADYNISRGVKKTSCHLFRHTFTKNWILNNGDLHSLQKILGHSTLDMVTKYANLWGEDLKPKVEKYSILATHHQKNSGRMIQRRNRA